eukprot:CAMPEP_0174346426 /NCGR_PEP_ID=MMETSP0811_2-20130205/2149_1 /TAXON_ID=73025 ORGANISM="Eutreptiella gymnastica-like, Strain CCMP1594" /NCGR_SAMPLE_ID=MMETSP0811_2 /ASSEMBLY_ACC=CAM_ASM_000667 /LENGTH=50 /DNA_ID=CAMNT_0015471003 /DNA_START=913 /DNA_END=1063 /DNA_ORIENTATION=-
MAHWKSLPQGDSKERRIDAAQLHAMSAAGLAKALPIVAVMALAYGQIFAQ